MKASGTKDVNNSQPHSIVGNINPTRLCYVDDSRTSAYVVKRLLRPYGYIVDHFNSAEPALIALVQQDYDLLLTDLKVSAKGMDGDDLVRALRNSGDEKISSMPVIVITGSTDQSILSEVYEAGANQIMNKPVSGDELDEEIRKLVFANKHQDNEEKNTGGSKNTFPNNISGESKPIVDSVTDTEEVASGTVVPFGAENIGARHNDAAKSTNDNIPVLKAVETALKIKSIEAKSAQEKLRNTPLSEPVTGGIDDSKTVNESKPVEKVDRRIIKPSYSPASRIRKSIKPQPAAGSVKPASRVVPTVTTPTTAESDDINYNPHISSDNVSTKIVNPTITRSPTQTANQRVLIKPTNTTQQRATSKVNSTTQQSQRIPVTTQVGTNRQAEALLAKKKAELVKKKRQAKKPVADKLNNETLSLEPIDADSLQIYKPSGPANGNDSVKPAAAPTARSSNAQANMHSKPFSNTDSIKPPPPPVQNYNNNINILHEMEKYPLVEADLASGYTPSRVVSAIGSIFELYGFKRLIMVVVLIVFAYFGYGTFQDMFNDGRPVEITTVEQGEIFQSITYPGKVVSKLRVNMTPSIAGRLTNIYVEEGDTVKSGDLLARLDDREAKSYLTRAQASYESAKEDVVLAERTLKRLKQAFTKGAVAKRLVEDAEVELRSSKARESIAEEETRSAKLNLENPKIVAPFAGTITSRLVEVGQWVVPSETLFTLIDEKQREVEVHVDAADSGGIAVGQTVGLSSDAFPGLEWSESVTRLAAATNNVGNANTVSVFISLGNNAPSLRFGQQVDADIRTAWNPNAIKVPFAAIINRKGTSWVATIENGKVNLVEVVTGIEDFSHVEILQGINVGQTIILANGMNLHQGDKVSLASNNML